MKLPVNKQDFISSLIVMGLGSFIIVHSLEYRLGSLERMGPGFYPLLLGIILTILGVFIFFSSALEVKEADDYDPIEWDVQIKTWLLVIGSVILFILLGGWFGLVPATLCLVFLSTLADDKNTVKTALISSVVLTVFTVALFHYGLKMQFPLFK